MKIFRRDQVKPENRVRITGLHSQDAFVRALRDAGYRLVKHDNGDRYMVRVLH